MSKRGGAMRYFFGDYALDPQRYELHRAGEPVKLRRKVFQVLVYLLEHRERIVPKQELLEQLWPEQFVGDEGLKSCVKTLRKALGERGRSQHFVHTLHGQGYRFVAHVEEREPLAADEAPPALPLPGGEEATRQAEVPSPLLTPPLAETGSPAWEAGDGEHKQVTVLCGALAEVPTLAARLGPEAMHSLMRDILALAQETVQRYEGSITQISGEGFLALFGAPVVQEDHARRAVLAALELRQRLHEPAALRGQPPGVVLRLGVHSGPVVVGPLAHDAQRPYTAMGATLHVATQLQQRAAPGTLLVSAATYALVQDEVQGEVGEPLALAAPSTPVPVYTICGLQRLRAGVPRRAARPLSRFVGRAQELALLHARLAQAVSGQGQVIGIAGEPGLGKSRLLAEFAHRLDGQAVTYCEGHCLAYGSTTPYLPVRDLLRQLWGLPDTAVPDAMTTTVQQRLNEAGVASEAEALLLLHLLDVPVDLALLAALSPPERKTRTFALLRHLIRHASQRQPLVLAVENLHWSDPTSDEWLASLVQRLAGLAEDTLQRGLAHLQGAELLYETRLFPDPVYTFKHALTHEVAYNGLLQERRRVLHAQIVDVLETLAGDRQDEQVDRLAHHALRGEVWAKALRYCQQAGAKALAGSAYREAVVCFEQALEALAHLPPDRTTLEQALDVRRDLRVALMPFGQWGQSWGITAVWDASTA